MSTRTEFQSAVEPKNAKLSRPSPFAIRLTKDERDLLTRRAGGTPLGTYIRECALGSDVRKRRASRAPKVDEKSIARLLSELGRSHLSSNLNQIAKAANIGTLPVTPDLEAELRQACADLREMRAVLIEALGLLEGNDQ